MSDITPEKLLELLDRLVRVATEKNLFNNYGNSFATAITALTVPTVINVRLVVDRPVTVSGTISLPSNITLDVRKGGLITVTGSLTIASMTQWSNHQCFTGSGTVTISPGAVEYLNIAWFGPTSDVNWGLTQCFSSLSSKGGTLFVPIGEWGIHGDHNIPNNVVIQGCSPSFGRVGGSPFATAGSSFVLTQNATNDIFHVLDLQRNITLRDITLDSKSYTCESQLRIYCATNGNNISGVYCDNVSLKGASTYNLKIDGTKPAGGDPGGHEIEQCTFNQLVCDGATTAAIYICTQNGCNTFNSPYLYCAGGTYAFDLELCGSMNIHNMTAIGSNSTPVNSVFFVNGPHLDINIFGGQEEGFTHYIYNNHDNSSIVCSFNLYGCLVQSQINMAQWGRVNIFAGRYFSHSIVATSAGCVVQSFGEEVRPYNLGDDVNGSPTVNPPELCSFASSNGIHTADIAWNHGTDSYLRSQHGTFQLPMRITQPIGNPAFVDMEGVPLLNLATHHDDTTAYHKVLLYLGERATDGTPANGYEFYRDEYGVLQIVGTQTGSYSGHPTGFKNVNFFGTSVGIGLTVPPFASLHIHSARSISTNDIMFSDADYGDYRNGIGNYFDGSTASENRMCFRVCNADPVTQVEAMTIDGSGKVGIGPTTPTATLHLREGKAATYGSPLKFTSGALLTTPEAGAVEFLTDRFYATITTGAARKTLAFTDDVTPGPQGAQGAQGSSGGTGSQGPQGYQGNAGSAGSQGSQGYQGNQGYQGAAWSGGDLTMSTHDIITDTVTGTKIGTASSQKIGFFGATPRTQQTNPGGLTDSTGGSAGSIIDTILGGGNTIDAATAENNFRRLLDRINALEGVLQNLGLTN